MLRGLAVYLYIVRRNLIPKKFHSRRRRRQFRRRARSRGISQLISSRGSMYKTTLLSPPLSLSLTHSGACEPEKSLRIWPREKFLVRVKKKRSQACYKYSVSFHNEWRLERAQETGAYHRRVHVYTHHTNRTAQMSIIVAGDKAPSSDDLTLWASFRLCKNSGWCYSRGYVCVCVCTEWHSVG